MDNELTNNFSKGVTVNKAARSLVPGPLKTGTTRGLDRTCIHSITCTKSCQDQSHPKTQNQLSQNMPSYQNRGLYPKTSPSSDGGHWRSDQVHSSSVHLPSDDEHDNGANKGNVTETSMKKTRTAEDPQGQEEKRSSREEGCARANRTASRP